MAIVFPGREDEGRATYTAFARCYLNETAVMEARNPSYPGWAAAGNLGSTLPRSLRKAADVGAGGRAHATAGQGECSAAEQSPRGDP